MKTTISLPDDIFEPAERTAAKMGRATELLDAVYAEHDSALDPRLAAMQLLSLDGAPGTPSGTGEEW